VPRVDLPLRALDRRRRLAARGRRPATARARRPHDRVIGNYDYIMDWRFQQDGADPRAVGATGIPAVKMARTHAPRERQARHDGRAR
jgi:Cu2+-containing amine oxidase